MHRQRVIGGLILLGAILIAAVLILLRSDPEEKPPTEQIPLVQAEPLEIRSGNLMIMGAGTVRAREELTLAAEVAGKLVYVNPALREGQLIGRGETLFRIDTSDYRNAVQTAQADVASQTVSVMQAREEVALAKAELARFQQRGGNAFVSVDSSDYAAQILPPDMLAKKTATNRKQPEQSMSANGLATREPQLKSAQAGLRRAEAKLADARTALKRTVVTAPFSGIVKAEQIALGSFVQPGQSLGSIVGTADYEAVIPLSEKEAALIPRLFQAGAGTRIEASIYSEYGGIRYRWSAYVDRVNRLLNPQTRTIDIFLRIPNPLRGGGAPAAQQNGHRQNATASSAPPLFVGSFVEAEITGKAIKEYAILPLSALKADNKIWLVRDNKLHIVTAEILQRTDKTALISASGLGQKPLVVTGSLKIATEGLRVRVAKPSVDKSAAKATTAK